MNMLFYALYAYVSIAVVLTVFGVFAGLKVDQKLKLGSFEWNPTTHFENVLCGALSGFLIGLIWPLAISVIFTAIGMFTIYTLIVKH